MRQISVLFLSMALAGCFHDDDVDPKPKEAVQRPAVPIAKTVNAVKCNLADFFRDPDNIYNDRYGLAKVGVTMTYATSLDIQDDGKLGLTLGLASDAIEVNASGSRTTALQRNSEFKPSFSFAILTEKKPEEQEDGTIKMVDKEPAELRGDAKEYAAEANASFNQICPNDTDIVLDTIEQDANGKLITRRIEPEDKSDLASREIKLNKQNGDDNKRMQPLALTSLLENYRDEINNIEAGQPKAVANTVTIKATLRAESQQVDGGSITILILTFGSENSRTASNAFTLEITLSLFEGGIGPFRPQ